MRITPKISVSPLASRNSSAPYETPLKIWISQKFASTGAQPFTTCSTLPLAAERNTASSADTLAIISDCGTGYGDRPAAASANASRLARTACAGEYSTDFLGSPRRCAVKVQPCGDSGCALSRTSAQPLLP